MTEEQVIDAPEETKKEEENFSPLVKDEMDLILKNSREMSDEEFRMTLVGLGRTIGKPQLAQHIANLMIQERVNHLSKSMDGKEAANKVRDSLIVKPVIKAPPLKALFPGLGAKKGKK